MPSSALVRSGIYYVPKICLKLHKFKSDWGQKKTFFPLQVEGNQYNEVEIFVTLLLGAIMLIGMKYEL